MRFSYIYFWQYLYRYRKILYAPFTMGKGFDPGVPTKNDMDSFWDYLEKCPWETKLPHPNLYDELPETWG